MTECVFNYILTYARKQARLDTNIGITMYQNQSKQVMKATLPTLWNQQCKLIELLLTIKPDIIICNDKQGTCMLIDVAIPGDRNVISKKDVKILKYNDLIMEIQRMWNVKVKVILVIMEENGTIS